LSVTVRVVAAFTSAAVQDLTTTSELPAHDVSGGVDPDTLLICRALILELATLFRSSTVRATLPEASERSATNLLMGSKVWLTHKIGLDRSQVTVLALRMVAVPVGIEPTVPLKEALALDQSEQ
jgi:hypothetical protein